MTPVSLPAAIFPLVEPARRPEQGEIDPAASKDPPGLPREPKRRRQQAEFGADRFLPRDAAEET